MLMGGFLAVLAMLLLQINLSLFLSPRVWAASDLDVIHYAAIAGAIVLLAMCGASAAFGLRGLACAYRRDQPSALGWAGLLISILALCLWIGALIDLFEVVDTLMRRHGMEGIF